MRAVIFMLCSVFCLSLTSLLTKFVSAYLSVYVVALLRLLIPSGLLFLLAGFRQWRLPPLNLRKAIVIRAICIAACQICFFLSLKQLSLVEGVVLFGTGPLFIPLLERIFWGWKLPLIPILSLGVTFCGVLLLTVTKQGFDFKPAVLLGLLGAVFNAGSQLSLHRVAKGELSPALLNGWTFLISGLCIVPILMVQGLSQVDEQWLAFNTHTLIGVGVMMALALFVVFNQLFRAKAYALVNASSQLAPLLFCNLLFATLWQALFFDQQFSHLQIIGIVVIVVSNIANQVLPKLTHKNKRLLANN